MTARIGEPVTCVTCGADVLWDEDRYRGDRLVLVEWHADRRRRHQCVCGAWMPRVEERCARRVGHSMSGGHRRRVVLDDDAANRRSLRIAA